MARELLGKVVAIRRDGGWVGGTITETEAYLGLNDPASHSHRGPTPRSRIMFGPPGVAYVYFVYGMHHCLNAVTEPEGTGAAVLIRALRPETGDSPAVTPVALPASRLRGPGLLCQALGITLAMNGYDLATSDLRILAAAEAPAKSVLVGPRVGIRQAADLPLRFRLEP
ncbi:MAG: DNA-3-methyladenine glycosylase [Candidatus Dormibacteria bacterium]